VPDVDQRGFDNQPAWLSAAAACALLDVKRQTLYAYVSRGLVRRVRGPDGARYARDDVARLRARHDARSGHGPAAAGALRWGEPVLASAITGIGPDGPRYRGRPAVQLAAAGVRFEAVAELLWTDALPATPPSWPPHLPLPLGKLRALLGSSRPRDAAPPTPFSPLQLAVAALRARDHAPYPAMLEHELARARALVRTLVGVAALATHPSRVEAAWSAPSVAAGTVLALGGRAEPRTVAALEQALVLSADHELNASSFTARICASAGGDLYACVLAALATMSGPRHGGECDRFEALVAEAGDARRARAAVAARMRRGDRMHGFGHPLYPAGDPRAAHLIAVARRHGRGVAALRTIDAVIDAVARAGGEPPTLDAGLVAVAVAVGLSPGAAGLVFALGRTAGWIAHVLEQRTEPSLLRPRARYVGR